MPGPNEKPETVKTKHNSTSKYARRFLWRKANVNGWPLPCCSEEDVAACNRATKGIQ